MKNNLRSANYPNLKKCIPRSHRCRHTGEVIWPHLFYYPLVCNLRLSEIHGTYPCSVCNQEGSNCRNCTRNWKELLTAGYDVDVYEMKSVPSLEVYNSAVIWGDRSLWERS